VRARRAALIRRSAPGGRCVLTGNAAGQLAATADRSLPSGRSLRAVVTPKEGWQLVPPLASAAVRPADCISAGLTQRLTRVVAGEYLCGVPVSDRDSPLITVRSGTLRARHGQHRWREL